MTKETGGPAFPVFPDTGSGHAAAFRGMTLRDYFAAKAMQADVSRVGYYSPGEHMYQAAKMAYAIADAMLKAKEL
jgi:hypothetical protein